MNPLLEYLPLDPIETISLGSLCTTTGEWYYEVPNTSGALSDANTDGYDDWLKGTFEAGATPVKPQIEDKDEGSGS